MAIEKQGYDPVEGEKVTGLIKAVEGIERLDPTVTDCTVTLSDCTDKQITLKVVTKRENSERIAYRDYRRDSI